MINIYIIIVKQCVKIIYTVFGCHGCQSFCKLFFSFIVIGQILSPFPSQESHI